MELRRLVRIYANIQDRLPLVVDWRLFRSLGIDMRKQASDHFGSARSFD